MPRSHFVPSEPPHLADALERPAQIAPHGPSPPFYVVTELFNAIVATSAKGRSRKGDRKKQCVEAVFEAWRSRVGKDLFPLVRLLIPDRDRQRPIYGMKEQALAKGYVAALGLSQQTSAAQTLINWRQPGFGDKVAGGNVDFSDTACEIIKSRSLVTKSQLTVDQVNDRLSELAKLSGDAKFKVLKVFNDNLTAEDQKWLIRIILKDLKISVRETTVLSVLHHDATDLFNVCSDLQRVCYTLYAPHISLPREDSSVGIFRAFRPMLCKRNERDLEHIVKIMTQSSNRNRTSIQQQDDFIIEEKLDGERMQLHKRGSEFRYWSRKDKEYTYLYGKSPQRSDGGSLTPWINEAFHANIEEIILDGEMLVWDPAIGKTQAFGNLKTAALNPTNDPLKARPLFRIFDVLYVKGKNQHGQSLVRKSLSQRQEAMKKFIRQIPGRIEYAYQEKGKTANDIKLALQKVLEERGEGLVVKRNDSVYVLNGREDTWVKVKPDYMDELGETMDLVVVGAYWGRGNRGGRFGSFLCALYDSSYQGSRDDPEARYLTFCKFGSGFSFSALDDLMQAKTHQHKWTPWDKKNPRKNPSWLVTGKVQPEMPDVWIHPHDSFVVTVKAAEIITGESFGVGMCLRFPRCIRFPNSSEQHVSYTSAMSTDEYWQLRSEVKEKRVGDNLDGHKAKRRKVPTRAKIGILSTAKGADVTSTQVARSIFQGITFYVLEGLNSEGGANKQELETLIYENGGDFVQAIPASDYKMIISPRDDFWGAQKVIKGGHSLIRPAWIVDSVAQRQRVPLEEKYYAHATEEAKASFDYTSASGTQNPISATLDREPDEMEEEEPDEEANNDGVENQRPVDSDSDVDTDAEEAENEFEAEASPSQNAHFDDTDKGDVLKGKATSTAGAGSAPGMGAGTDEKEFDEEELFSALVFYVDTYENARENDLQHGEVDPEVSKELKEIEELLVSNGGTITRDLKDTKLTHIVASDNDTSRCVDLMRLTSQPRRRRLVTAQWISDSVAEGTPVSEADYIPNF